MPEPTPFMPPVWAYEPQSVARARAQSDFQQLSDQVSPLVAQGDPLSLAQAQNIADQARQPAGADAIRSNDLAQSIGSHVETNLSQPQDSGFLPELGNVLGGAFHALTSAEGFGNFLDTAIHHSPFENLSDIQRSGTEGTAGTSLGQDIGSIPGVGGVARTAFDVGASPLSVTTAGTGGLGVAALGDTFLSRIAAQTAAGVASKYGSEAASGIAQNLGAPQPVQALAGLAGGLAGGVGGIAGAKSVGGALSALGSADEEAALRAAAGPLEQAAPARVGMPLPDRPGTFAPANYTLSGGAEEPSISPNGIVNEETASGGLKPNLDRTNLIRSRMGLSPLEQAPAAWGTTTATDIPAATSTAGSASLADTIAQLQREGLTPRQAMADPRFQQAASQVFQSETPAVEQSLPVTPGGTGEQIGNAIIQKYEQASAGAPASGSPDLPQQSVRSPWATGVTKNYQAAQDAIDSFEDALAAKYGEDAAIHPEQYATPSELQHFNSLYAARDAIGSAEDDSAMSQTISRLSPDALNGPISEPAIYRALTKVAAEVESAAAQGYQQPFTTPVDLARRLQGELAPVADIRDVTPEQARQISAIARDLTSSSATALPQTLEVGSVQPAEAPIRSAADESKMADLMAHPDEPFGQSPEDIARQQTQDAIARSVARHFGNGEPPVEPPTSDLTGGEAGEGPPSGPSLLQRASGVPSDLANASRSLVATGDLHATIMRGAILAPSHPQEWWNAVKQQVQAYVNPQTALDAQQAIESDPSYLAAQASGLDQVPLRSVGNPASQEEDYLSAGPISNFVNNLGPVARSHAAFSIFGNKLRFDTFKAITSGWDPDQLGTPVLDAEGNVTAFNPSKSASDLASFLNAATGRGDLPQFMEQHAPTMNALFFAPRRLTGLIQAHTALATATPQVRQEVAKSLGAFYGTGIALLAAAKMGGANVGVDPRSSDFGKIVLPNGTRLDFWAGMTPIVRTIAQIATQSQKSSVSGNVYPKAWQDTVMNFLRGKLAPIPSLATDVLTNTQQGGTEELQTGPGDIATRAAELATPMFLQDLIQGVKAQGLTGGLAAVPAGVGISSYTPTPNAADAASRQMFGKSFAELMPTEKSSVLAANPGLQQQQLQDASLQAGAGGQAAQEKINEQAQQTASDAALASGQLTPQQWQQQRSDRLTKQRGALAQIYGNADTTQSLEQLQQQAQTDPKAKYYLAIQQSIDPATQAISQTKLASIRAGWTPEENAAVDKAMGTTGTPVEQLYRQSAADFFSTPKYLGYTGQEGDLIDRIHSLVTAYAQQLPGDKSLNEQRIFRQMQTNGNFDGIPDNVLLGVRRDIVGALPQAPFRAQLTRTDPLTALFFGSQLRPGQLAAAQGQLQQAVKS